MIKVKAKNQNIDLALFKEVNTLGNIEESIKSYRLSLDRLLREKEESIRTLTSYGAEVIDDAEDSTVSITKIEYDRLLRDSFALQCLEAGGVANWDWYWDSLEPYRAKYWDWYQDSLEPYRAKYGDED